MVRVAASRSEINLIRLLAQCEERASTNNEEDWRIEKYMEKLDDLLAQTEKSSRKPDDDKLKEYKKKIAFLKDFIVSKKLPSTAEKALATQLLIPSKTQTISSLVSSPTGTQIKQVAAAKYNNQMKKDLLSKESPNNDDTVRLRTVSHSRDVEEALRHQREQHDRIAKDMISLAQNLKHNISASGVIIREDTKTIQDATRKAEQNVTQLKHESSRLESHLHKGTNWSLWIALAVVCATFLFMIFFIRFFPKPR